MNHIHHIIPRHAGGTDDPSNLVSLTIEEHAEAHKLLFEKYGKDEDRIAWLALSGQISKKEVLVESYRIGRNKTNQVLFERYGEDWRSIVGINGGNATKEAKIGVHGLSKEQVLAYAKEGCIKAASKEACEKRLKTMATICHQQGTKNSQFRSMWITDGTNSKKINKSDSIPEGWRKGRKMNNADMVE